MLVDNIVSNCLRFSLSLRGDSGCDYRSGLLVIAGDRAWGVLNRVCGKMFFLGVGCGVLGVGCGVWGVGCRVWGVFSVN